MTQIIELTVQKAIIAYLQELGYFRIENSIHYLLSLSLQQKTLELTVVRNPRQFG